MSPEVAGCVEGAGHQAQVDGMQKPVSEARSKAARKNGQKSRGPKTPEGKNISRLNAVKHGLHATLLPPVLGGREFDLDLSFDSRLLFNSRGPLEDLIAEAVKAASVNLNLAQMARTAFLAQLEELDQAGALDGKLSRETLALRMREAHQRQQRMSHRKDDSATLLLQRSDRPMVDDAYLLLQANLRYPDILKSFDEQIARAEKELAGAQARARQMVLDGLEFAEGRHKALDRCNHSIDINEALLWRRFRRPTSVPMSENLGHVAEPTGVTEALEQTREPASAVTAPEGKSEPAGSVDGGSVITI